MIPAPHDRYRVLSAFVEKAGPSIQMSVSPVCMVRPISSAAFLMMPRSLPQKLDYRLRYILVFKAMDFNIQTITRIIATKTVEEGGAFFYTVKFDEMSESASKVLKKYVYEHL